MRFLILGLILCTVTHGQTHQEMVNHLRKKTRPITRQETGWVHYVTPEQERIDAEVVKFKPADPYASTLFLKKWSQERIVEATKIPYPSTQDYERIEGTKTFREVNEDVRGLQPWEILSE